MTDKETTEDDEAPDSAKPSKPAETPRAPAPLPPKVERALAAAREAASADHKRKAGRWLVVIPLSIGVILLLFMLPRSTPPDGVPLPRVNHRVTTAVAEAEDRLASEAEENRLPGDVLSVGTLIRDLNAVELEVNESERLILRTKLDNMLGVVLRRPGADQELIKLRSLQIRTFLNALHEWEAGGEPKDWSATGASFVIRAQEAGWIEGRRILLDETQRRVAYKTVWNAMTHLSAGPYATTLDEERALYAFYISHPRVPENHRLALEGKRRDSKTPEECARSRADWRRETETWRADKIKRLAALDSSYPAQYALGVAYFHAGRSDLSVDAFNTYLEVHPEGPYALRARNHLKAALIGTTP